MHTDVLCEGVYVCLSCKYKYCRRHEVSIQCTEEASAMSMTGLPAKHVSVMMII